MTPQETAVTLNLIPGLGPVRIMRLMRAFASPELVLEAPAAMLAAVRASDRNWPGASLPGKASSTRTGNSNWRPGRAFP